jgi:hypothetical protein
MDLRNYIYGVLDDQDSDSHRDWREKVGSVRPQFQLTDLHKPYKIKINIAILQMSHHTQTISKLAR